MVLHIVCPLFKSQHKMHTYTTFSFRPASPKRKGTGAGGKWQTSNGTSTQWRSYRPRLFWPLKAATRPKAKTEAQILARWGNWAPVYTWHPLKEVKVWCLIQLATGTWLGEGRLCKIAQTMWQAKQAEKFLPRRNRILSPAASLEVRLHGAFVASFLWWKALSRAWARRGQKIPNAA